MNKFINIDSVPETPVYSLSKLVELALENEATKQELIDNTADNKRALDIGMSLDDLHIVIGKIEKPTNIDNALIQSASNMAVSGTDLSAKAAIPTMENLLSRVSSINKSFIHELSEPFAKVEGLLENYVGQLRDNKKRIMQLSDKFLQTVDDTPRNVVFGLKDATVLNTYVGVVKTQGELITSIGVTAENINSLCSMLAIVVPKLNASLLEIDPVLNETTQEVLLDNIKKGNTLLSKTIEEIWKSNISKSYLTIGSENSTMVSAQTSGSAGCHEMCFNMRQVDVVSETDNSFIREAQTIKSIELVHKEIPYQNINGQTFEIKNVTNASMTLLINNILSFIGDLEKILSWSIINTISAKEKCFKNANRLDSYFSKLTLLASNPKNSDDYRFHLELYVSNLQTVSNSMLTMVLDPVKYSIDLIQDLTIVLETISIK